MPRARVNRARLRLDRAAPARYRGRADFSRLRGDAMSAALPPPAPPPAAVTVGWRRAALAGLAVTLAQVTLACLLTGQSELCAAYEKLVLWDGGWYEEIYKDGYKCPKAQTADDLGNVAFFPGFPLLARQVGEIGRASGRES